MLIMRGSLSYVWQRVTHHMYSRLSIHPKPFFPYLKHYVSLCICLSGATIPTVFGSPAGLHYVLSHRRAGEPFLPASTIILQLRPSQTRAPRSTWLRTFWPPCYHHVLCGFPLVVKGVLLPFEYFQNAQLEVLLWTRFPHDTFMSR